MTHLPEWKVISTETVQKGRFRPSKKPPNTGLLWYNSIR